MKRLGLLLVACMIIIVPGMSIAQSGFSVDKFDNFTFHTYQSNDPMGDVSFVIESKNELVILEPQAFKDNVFEFREYVQKLNKPVAKMLISFHPVGLKSYKEGESVITAPMEGFLHSDAAKGMLAHFKEAFKGAMDVEVVPFDSIIPSDSKLEIDGVTYTLYPTSLPGMPGVNVDIDGKVLYQHFAPAANTHASPFQIDSKSAIEGALADAVKAKVNGYELFVGSHFPGKGEIEDLQFQINYLEKMKTAAAESENAEDFVQRMNKVYPEIGGMENLKVIAAKMYK